MTLWTIQAFPAWHAFQETGELQGSSNHFCEYTNVFAYAWMARQMASRIGLPPHEDSAPVWAWLQWEGASRPQPDLRCSAHLPPGTRGVKLEIEVDAKKVLPSDFELWHYVLNYWYLPSSNKDAVEFEQMLAARCARSPADLPSSETVLHNRVQASWQRIFELDWALIDYASPRPEKSIQACLWQLSLDQVRKVKEFTAR